MAEIANLFRRCIDWIQNRLVRNIVGPRPQVSTRPQIDKFESSQFFGKDDIQRLHISMHKSG